MQGGADSPSTCTRHSIYTRRPAEGVGRGAAGARSSTTTWTEDSFVAGHEARSTRGRCPRCVRWSKPALARRD
jgi:hypothetical protein